MHHALHPSLHKHLHVMAEESYMLNSTNHILHHQHRHMMRADGPMRGTRRSLGSSSSGGNRREKADALSAVEWTLDGNVGKRRDPTDTASYHSCYTSWTCDFQSDKRELSELGSFASSSTAVAKRIYSLSTTLPLSNPNNRTAVDGTSSSKWLMTTSAVFGSSRSSRNRLTH